MAGNEKQEKTQLRDDPFPERDTTADARFATIGRLTVQIHSQEQLVKDADACLNELGAWVQTAARSLMMSADNPGIPTAVRKHADLLPLLQLIDRAKSAKSTMGPLRDELERLTAAQ